MLSVSNISIINYNIGYATDFYRLVEKVNASRGCVKYKRHLTRFAICWLLAGFVSFLAFTTTMYMFQTDSKSLWSHLQLLFIPQLNWPAVILGCVLLILYLSVHFLKNFQV
jgi:hypothetical protein